MSTRAPSCAFVGPGASRLAVRALRASRSPGGGVPLVVRWGSAPTPRPNGLGRPGLRRAAQALAASVAGGAEVSVEGAVLAAQVEAGPDAGAVVLALLQAYDGPVGLAVEVPRDDDVDVALRTVDEVVLVAPAEAALRALAEEELGAVTRRLTVAPARRSGLARLLGGEAGQTMVVAVAVVATLMAMAVGLGLVASALGRASDVQGRADVSALAGARALLDAQSALYSADPASRISVAEYRARGIRAAERTATANGLAKPEVKLLGDPALPTRVQIRTTSAGPRARDRRRRVRAVAEVALSALPATAGVGDYQGPLAVRQGQRMRPDVALAFDRMAAAASTAGHALTITSAFRSDAEQAELFRRHPDPKWVAPPGKSLHRLGTELDLGPSSAWGWLAAHCERFGFRKRYSWEAWHFGYVRAAGSTSLGYRERVAGTERGGGDRKASGSAIPSFVPAAYAPMLSRAAQRWSVGAALLGAQLWQESRFNPRAVSPVGAAGIAQFMPGTGLQYGLTPAERFDPAKAIDAQAHLMHDLLRQFGSVPLALAAYNAGPGNVSKCMCVPPFAETQGYVLAILALLGGAGVAAPAGLQIRLVA